MGKELWLVVRALAEENNGSSPWGRGSHKEGSGFREGAAVYTHKAQIPEVNIAKNYRVLWQPTLQVSAAATRAIDSSVSKTVAVPPFSFTPQEEVMANRILLELGPVQEYTCYSVQVLVLVSKMGTHIAATEPGSWVCTWLWNMSSKQLQPWKNGRTVMPPSPGGGTVQELQADPLAGLSNSEDCKHPQ